jgi:peptidoglycan/LPS O-acetylase OafA/YrhL
MLDSFIPRRTREYDAMITLLEANVAEPRPARRIPTWLHSGRIPCLDGLRAISILLVIIAHARLTDGFPAIRYLQPTPAYGDLGVDIFFVISGFLITLLLLREHDRTGKISLKYFYARRSLRILPAMFAFLMFIAGLQIAGIVRLNAVDWASALTYTVNFHGPFDQSTRPIEHLWSLSLEEHFYLVWPLMLVLVGRSRASWVLFAAIVFSPMVRFLGRGWFDAHQFNMDRVTPARLDTIAFGCLLAVTVSDPRAQPLMRKLGRHAGWVVLACVAVIVVSVSILSASGKYALLIDRTVTAAAISLMVAACIYGNKTLLGCVLESRMFVSLGVMSYSLYLWQQPFLWRGGKWFGSYWPLNIVLTFAAAAASYCFVEIPFLRMKDRLATKLPR